MNQAISSAIGAGIAARRCDMFVDNTYRTTKVYESMAIMILVCVTGMGATM